MKAREAVLEILKAKGGSLDLSELSHELNKRGLPGFGIEVIDLVRDLSVRRRVKYNRATEMVTLCVD